MDIFWGELGEVLYEYVAVVRKFLFLKDCVILGNIYSGVEHYTSIICDGQIHLSPRQWFQIT